jgi:hypothetical protein
MAKEITKEEKKRKTYSLDNERSGDLARHSLDLSDEIGKTVPRQAVLDALVECLKDKTVYSKVRNILKKKI